MLYYTLEATAHQAAIGAVSHRKRILKTFCAFSAHESKQRCAGNAHARRERLKACRAADFNISTAGFSRVFSPDRQNH
jgi:hypothetical protein